MALCWPYVLFTAASFTGGFVLARLFALCKIEALVCTTRRPRAKMDELKKTSDPEKRLLAETMPYAEIFTRVMVNLQKHPMRKPSG